MRRLISTSIVIIMHCCVMWPVSMWAMISWLRCWWAMSFFICGKCVRNSIFRFRYGVIWCVPYGITAWIIWAPRKNGRKWLFPLFRKKGKCVTCCRTITRWVVCWSMSWRKKFTRPFIIYRRSAEKFS